jgi:hypothetical protein
MASWPIKAAEAAKFHAGAAETECPMLAKEAAERGVTLAQLVAKVDGNASRFSALESMIGGTDGKHRDAISALQTFVDVADYDFSTGWPDV